jgi:DNA-binding GntR family transcriptional regulator
MVFEKDFDILTISETWFNSSVSNASVALDGYKLYRLDRLRKVGGGVCAYIRNNLKAKILNHQRDNDLWLSPALAKCSK